MKSNCCNEIDEMKLNQWNENNAAQWNWIGWGLWAGGHLRSSTSFLQQKNC